MNLGKQRTQFHKTEEPKNLEDHLYKLKEDNIKQQNDVMENILQFEKEVLTNYEIVCKIMSDKKYSQQNLLSLMRAIMRGGGEREVAKSKI